VSQGWRSRAGLAGLLLTAALPWCWFAVRDLRGGLDGPATALPIPIAAGAVVALLVAVIRRSRVLTGVGLSWAAMGAVAVVGPWLPQRGPAPVQPIRVVEANAFHGNHTLDKTLADVLGQKGDLVVVTESSTRAARALAGAYPYQEKARGGDRLVLSRFPLRRLDRPAILPKSLSAERWEVQAGSGPLVLYTLRLSRPHAREPEQIGEALATQKTQVHALARAIAAERLPALVVGDLNMSDRTSSFRRLAGPLRDAMRAGLAGPTYMRPLYRPLLLRIDHILIPRRWCARRAHTFTLRGSDHRGIATEVGPCH
jgi:endonuclease/exonuclease/phosphatase (EEP) superfamily protein YafD